VGQAINAVTGTRRFGRLFFLPKNVLAFTLQPALPPGCCCATVRISLRSPTNDVATPPAFGPWQDGSLLSSLSTPFGQPQAPAPQIAIDTPHNQFVLVEKHFTSTAATVSQSNDPNDNPTKPVQTAGSEISRPVIPIAHPSAPVA
jgi:hypothetical protein